MPEGTVLHPTEPGRKSPRAASSLTEGNSLQPPWVASSLPVLGARQLPDPAEMFNALPHLHKA